MATMTITNAKTGGTSIYLTGTVDEGAAGIVTYDAVVAISDRKHDAWDAAKAAIDKALGLEA